ncbi:hypothetical protein GCM10020254_50920 [Streptomyces goshikiensis]
MPGQFLQDGPDRRPARPGGDEADGAVGAEERELPAGRAEPQHLAGAHLADQGGAEQAPSIRLTCRSRVWSGRGALPREYVRQTPGTRSLLTLTYCPGRWGSGRCGRRVRTPMSRPYWRWRTTSASHQGGSSLDPAPSVMVSAITW